MKKLILQLVLIFVTPYLINSQTIGVDKLNTFGNPGWETISDMATDPDGNYYICGSFSGELQLGGETISSKGKRDIFLAKIDGADKVLWLKNYGGLSDDNAYSLLYHQGNIYLAGSFRKEISFTEGIQLQAQNFTDVFLAKLDTEGVVDKAKALTSQSPAQKAFLQKDVAGNIIIAGTFKKTLTIGGTPLSSNGKTDIYYATFNAQGDFENPTSFGGEGEEQLYDFLISPADTLYFAGSFDKSFQSGPFDLSPTGKTDGFIIKMDNTGQTTLAQQFGGNYKDALTHIDIDAENNIYLAGEFEHEVTIGNNDYTANRKRDVFLVQLSADGNLNWGTTLGGDSYNTVSSLGLGQNGQFYISGSFRGEIGTKKSQRNSKDAFIAKYQGDQRDWITNAGHNNEDNLTLMVSPTGELLGRGYFSHSFIFK